jgi:hypothetical protein
MSEDPQVLAAQANFADVLSTVETTSPQDLHSKNLCTDSLQAALDGDKAALGDYYKEARLLLERRLADTTETVREKTAQKLTASADEAREQASLESLKAAALAIPQTE